MADSPFKFIEYINRAKELNEEELKEFMPYLLQKGYYFGGNELLVNQLNKAWKLPKRLQYKLFCVLLGGRKTAWIKKVKAKEDEKILEYFKVKYGCSTKIAREYMAIFNKEDLQKLKKEVEDY
jgi:hypothetical protein